MKKCTSVYFITASVLLSVVLFLVSVLPAAAETTLFSTQDTLAPSGTKQYSIDIPSPGVLTISMTGWEGTFNWGTDYDRLYIYNSAGEAIDRNNQSSESDPFIGHMMGNPMTLTTRVGNAGVYSLHLHSGSASGWPQGKTMQNYTVSVIHTPVVDDNEVNDSIAQATALPVGQTITSYQWKRTSKADVYGDEDWYRIEIPSPGILTVNIDNWISTFNWGVDYDRMYICRSNGVMFDGDGAEEPYTWMMGETSATSVNVGYGGSYYIGLHAGNGTNTEPYTIRVDFTPVNDVREPNEDMESASKIELGEIYEAYQWRSLEQGPAIAGDQDWYRIDVPSPGLMKISLKDWKSLYNWGLDVDYLWLYDAEGVLFGPNGSTDAFSWMMGDDPVIEARLSAGGTYYLRFHSGTASDAIPYTLQVDFQEVDDPFERNDTFLTAKGIAPGAEHSAWQWKSLVQGSMYVGDEDFYSFTVTEACDLAITITGWKSTYNWGADYDRLWLYRAVSDADSIRYDTMIEGWMLGGNYTKTTNVEAGHYILRLHSGAAWSLDPYTIKLDYTGIGGTSVEETAPVDFNVFNPYPNPFNPSTTLSFSLPDEMNVTVEIYSYSGQKIRSLMDTILSPGMHSVTWNGTNDSGTTVAAGVYFMSLRAGNNHAARKVLLIK